MYKLFLFALVFLHLQVVAQNDSNKIYKTSSLSVKVDTNSIFGTLTIPDKVSKYPLVFIIAGSGHTDRDGNQTPNLISNAYKQLAEKLADNGIASLRYDKRGVGESIFMMGEQALRFDHFIDDASLWINELKKDKQFTKVVVAGHSEGSLIGLMACLKTKADAYISIAGAGYAIDEILKKQLVAAIPDTSYYNKSCRYLDTLKQGKTLTNSDPALGSLFRPSIQPYMINWIKYDPSIEIKKLNIPALIIQGENDIQVDIENANQLQKAKPNAQMQVIKGMNHVLKFAEKNREKNLAAYGNPELQIVPECVDAIVEFVKSN
ncbi:MAG: alpha/beta hydrolase [Bacteroidetes bacterium]|nr:alpha/beta hydrolase [Bacteroidota bacterium]